MAQGLLQNVDLMGQPECYFSSLPEELESKRDRLAAILRDVGMTPIVPEGGYFMLVDVSSLSEWLNINITALMHLNWRFVMSVSTPDDHFVPRILVNCISPYCVFFLQIWTCPI